MSDTLPQPFGYIMRDIHGNACEVLGYTAEQLAAAVAMERERWAEAVTAELDSNGHAKAIVAAATACGHRWMVTQQGMTYHDCRCEKCGATKRESWD